jgi:hypothetical protein
MRDYAEVLGLVDPMRGNAAPPPTAVILSGTYDAAKSRAELPRIAVDDVAERNWSSDRRISSHCKLSAAPSLESDLPARGSEE